MSVIERLKKHILVDGFHVTVDLKKSEGSWIVDADTGKRYLDCYSQFASQPLGWNHPGLHKVRDKLADAALHKLANSDMYSEPYCEFVEAFAGITPDFNYYFFIDGGALGVENALKAAFDWKAQKSDMKSYNEVNALKVVGFRNAFHGRTGYTLSLTNTDENKTKWFPKFQWEHVTNPTVSNPYIARSIESWEDTALSLIKTHLSGNRVAAVILETIQGEGGDNHYRTEFYKKLRELVDRHETLLIFDEVQTGVGLTGKMWAYEHFGVVPDMMCFGKKTQVCGFCSTKKIDSVPTNVFHTSSRINSTWGGNIVDMVRSTAIIETIKEENLVENAAVVGEHFLNRLKELEGGPVSNVRGRGLMIAFDLPDTPHRNGVYEKLHDNMLALKSGERSLRFRPVLTFTKDDADQAVEFIKKTLS